MASDVEIPAGVRVSALSLTAVKGTRLRAVQQVELERGGARGDRRFFVADDRGRMVNAKNLEALPTVVADYDEARDVLSLTFLDGSAVADGLRRGDPVEVRFFSAPARARPVLGPWSAALSAHVGQSVRLMELLPGDFRGSGVDRGYGGAVSLISRGSLQRLAAQAEVDEVDARRFRMLIEVDGVPAHAEDGWIGRRVRIGEALIRFAGHVGRCLVTSRHPDSGVIDLPTLDILGDYRRDLDTTEPLPFGVYGEVLEPGIVRIGDAVAPSPAPRG